MINFSAAVDTTVERPYRQRLELAGLGSYIMLLLHWDEMRKYASSAWQATTGSYYRANSLDQGVASATAGQDRGLSEHTAPLQLPWFQKTVTKG